MSVVEKEKSLETRDQRCEHLVRVSPIRHAFPAHSRTFKAHVRDLFRDVFRIKGDYDFINHNTVCVSVASQYETYGVGGPDPENLVFDLQYSPIMNSKWNRRVFCILLERLMERRQAELCVVRRTWA